MASVYLGSEQASERKQNNLTKRKHKRKAQAQSASAKRKRKAQSENRLKEKQKLDTMERKKGKQKTKERRKNTMAQSKAQATNKYRKSHYESFLLQFPKGTKTKLSDYAKAHNFQSLTALICYLLEKETGISCKLENGLAWLKK